MTIAAQKGQSVTEYGIVIALVVLAAIPALFLLGNTMQNNLASNTPSKSQMNTLLSLLNNNPATGSGGVRQGGARAGTPATGSSGQSEPGGPLGTALDGTSVPGAGAVDDDSEMTTSAEGGKVVTGQDSSGYLGGARAPKVGQRGGNWQNPDLDKLIEEKLSKSPLAGSATTPSANPATRLIQQAIAVEQSLQNIKTSQNLLLKASDGSSQAFQQTSQQLQQAHQQYTQAQSGLSSTLYASGSAAFQKQADQMAQDPVIIKKSVEAFDAGHSQAQMRQAAAQTEQVLVGVHGFRARLSL